LDFIKFQSLLDQVNITSLRKLKLDLYNSAANYHRYRTDWYFANDEERILMDEPRRIAHNVFIDCCNILSRNMIKNGEDASWRNELGDDRKTIGDFGCFVSFSIGVLAR